MQGASRCLFSFISLISTLNIKTNIVLLSSLDSFMVKLLDAIQEFIFQSSYEFTEATVVFVLLSSNFI